MNRISIRSFSGQLMFDLKSKTALEKDNVSIDKNPRFAYKCIYNIP